MNIIADGSEHGVPSPDMGQAIIAEKGSFRMDLKQSGCTPLHLLPGLSLHAPSDLCQPDSSSGFYHPRSRLKWGSCLVDFSVLELK